MREYNKLFISIGLLVILLNATAVCAEKIRSDLFAQEPKKDVISDHQDIKAPSEKMITWLRHNRHSPAGLPFSHVGDNELFDWVITYDSAVVTMAYIAMGENEEARRIIDFYINTPSAWRLDGIIEAFVIVDVDKGVIEGKDWLVKTGANLWMGLAGYHLSMATGDRKYLEFAERIADLALLGQNKNETDANFGGISLGPEGDPEHQGDQTIDYDLNKPAFSNIYSTEINIDAYALFTFLYQETRNPRYQHALEGIWGWLKREAYNEEELRLNRGYSDGTMASDVQSWGVSALGFEKLNEIKEGLAENMLKAVEELCTATVSFEKLDGAMVNVSGVDFTDYKQRAEELKRGPMVSPEWTFQLANAYLNLENYFASISESEKAGIYRDKRQALIQNMLTLAVEQDEGLAYPYATLAGADVGHGHHTPQQPSLSAIGAAYGILALMKFDPLSNLKK